METKTQQLIIKTLGTIALLGEIGTILLIYTIQPIDIAIITALITFISGITGGLIGFLGGKTLTEKQQETLNTTTTPNITDQDIIQIIEDLENNTEEPQNVQ